MIRIAIAEDKLSLLNLVKNKLAEFEDIEIAFVAPNGQILVNQIGNHGRIDAVLMDIEMPEMDGIEATKEVKKINPSIKVLMLTVFDADDKIFQSLMAGASGYLLKDEEGNQIYEALKTVHDGGATMSPSIALKVIHLLKNPPKETSTANSEKRATITKREREILEQLSKGLDYKGIAANLFIEKATVKKHIENIYRKLDVHNKMEAVNIAKDQGWV